jgi:putative sterol carrier protein
MDDTGASNQLITGLAEAPWVVQVSPADLQALLTGQMNLMNAFLSGKLRIHVDGKLALQLQKLFQT